MSRKENVDELVNALKAFTQDRLEQDDKAVLLSDYLSDVSLLTDQDKDSDDDNTPRVTIMTIHSAKGLEFNTVFVVGMEEGLFPNLRNDGNGTASLRELEEERRLFYVALTRAEQHCFLTFAKMRFHYGKMEFSSPSRFLNDIDRTYLVVDGAGNTTTRTVATEQGASAMSSRPQTLKRLGSTLVSPSHTDNGTAALSVGQTIEHERFGVGTVIGVDGAGDDARATIEFKNAGVKKLLLRFARFKVVS